jgi:hypothetical protein
MKRETAGQRPAESAGSKSRPRSDFTGLTSIILASCPARQGQQRSLRKVGQVLSWTPEIDFCPSDLGPCSKEPVPLAVGHRYVIPHNDIVRQT